MSGISKLSSFMGLRRRKDTPRVLRKQVVVPPNGDLLMQSRALPQSGRGALATSRTGSGCKLISSRRFPAVRYATRMSFVTPCHRIVRYDDPAQDGSIALDDGPCGCRVWSEERRD